MEMIDVAKDNMIRVATRAESRIVGLLRGGMVMVTWASLSGQDGLQR